MHKQNGGDDLPIRKDNGPFWKGKQQPEEAH